LVRITVDELKVPSRRFYNRKVQRYVAEQIRDKMQAQNPKWTWHVGLTLRDRVGLDIDALTALFDSSFSRVVQPQVPEVVDDIAKWVANWTRSEVAVFQTAHGYWVIAKNEVSNEEYQRFYRTALSTWFDYIDVIHAMLSIRYNKTTFRLDEKNGVGHHIIKTVSPTNW
jgi:hypothetical protein